MNKINIGRSLLETITIALYENPIILFREYVQNSLDAYNEAKKAGKKEIRDFHVSINIDKSCRKIVITDNGYGINTKEKFNEKMLTIGSSDKTKDRARYIGFRGIGRISGWPFCKKLTFRNKAENSDKVNVCVWKNEKYRELLDDDNGKDDLEYTIRQIVDTDVEDTNYERKSDHFFQVILEEYSKEIEDLIGEKKFEERLIRMLPLKYKDNFKGAKKIIKRYNDFMNDDIEKYMVDVTYNKKLLRKAYDDKFILGSDIVFWELRGRKKKDGSMGNKIGLLWFTFDRQIKANNLNERLNEYYGVLTRSKNVLMGTNDTFAQVADESNSYVTTFREMTQALRGIYGELLIHSLSLRDNSRRDWFLIDEHSAELNTIITEFMRRLNDYRYCASRYFKRNPSKDKDDLKKALSGLVNIEDNKINFEYFYKKEKTEEKEDERLFLEDKSMKKCYDALMKVIESFFKKIRQRALFLQLRAYLINHFKNR